MPQWRIYYDTFTYDSDMGPPESAPPWGVQCIVQQCEYEGKNIQSHEDCYWFDPDEKRWYGGDFLGLCDFLARKVGVVRFGRRLASIKWDEVLQRAMSDPDFVGKGVSRVELPTRVLR